MPKATITYNSQTISDVDETAPVSVSYNGTTIATVAAGDSKTLNCNGKVMASNVVIGSKALNCAGKIMASNVLIVVESSRFNPVFANNSWEDIILACQLNAVPSTWAVADHKDMVINNVTYQIDIIGKDHDDYTAGGTAPLTFQMHDCYADAKNMNSSNTNAGGWKNCAMRTTNLPTILNSMPTAVKNAIRDVNKLSSAGSKSSSIDKTADKLFLLSETEIFGRALYSKSGEGRRYAYYAASNPKKKYRSESLTVWWMRSPSGSRSDWFCSVATSGNSNNNTSNNASNSNGVAFAFCF